MGLLYLLPLPYLPSCKHYINRNNTIFGGMMPCGMMPCGMMPCGVIKVYERFVEIYFLHIQSGIYCRYNLVTHVHQNICMSARRVRLSIEDKKHLPSQPVQGALSSWIRQAFHEFDHYFPSTAKLKNVWR